MLEEMSGRGPLGPFIGGINLKEVSPILNAGFFSLRMNMGRLLAPAQMFHRDRFTRRKAIKNFVTAITTYSAFLFAGNKMGLWDLELDPRSSDFMKIQLMDGRVTVDIWGGMQQFVVLYGRLLSAFGSSAGYPTLKTIRGQEMRVSEDIVANFIRSKASPLADNILVTWSGSDYRGSNVDRSNLMYWVKKNTPKTGQDFYEVYNEFGLTGLPLGIPGIVGMGVQPRDLPRWAELDKYYSYSGKPNAKALRKQFRKDPMNCSFGVISRHLSFLPL